MEGEKIFMNQKQLQRFQVMDLVEAGEMTLKEAAERDRNILPADQTDSKEGRRGVRDWFTE